MKYSVDNNGYIKSLINGKLPSSKINSGWKVYETIVKLEIYKDGRPQYKVVNNQHIKTSESDFQKPQRKETAEELSQKRASLRRSAYRSRTDDMLLEYLRENTPNLPAELLAEIEKIKLEYPI